MQVDDCGRSSLANAPIPESGRFVNAKLKRSVSARLYRFLERVRFVVAVTRAPSPADDRSKSDYRSPSTR